MFNDRNYGGCEQLLHLHLSEDKLDIEARLLLAKAYKNMQRHDLALQTADAALNIAQALNRDSQNIAQFIFEVSTEKARRDEEERASHVTESSQTMPQELEPPPTNPAPRNSGQQQWKSDADAFRALRGFSPYFGFPDRPHVNNTNNYGFRWANGTEPVDYPYVPERDEYVIAIYGGSVAGGFLQDTIEYLTATLSKHPDLSGRRVRLLQFAMGAQKQPISLFYLNYFAALKQTIDLVINIDGFNDVRNSIVNLESGHHFLMPHAAIAKTFDAYVSVPTLDLAYLDYFRSVAKLKKRITAAESRSFRLLKSIGYLDWLKRKYAELAVRPPRNDGDMSLMLTVPANKVTFLDLDADAQNRLADDVAGAWYTCTRLMLASCQTMGMQYIHAVQPTHFFSQRKHLSSREKEWIIDAPKKDRGQATTKRIIEVCYPKLVELASTLGKQVYCHMIDVLDDAHEEVFLDHECHFNPAGHHLMARRLCEFIQGMRLHVRPLSNG